MVHNDGQVVGTRATAGCAGFSIFSDYDAFICVHGNYVRDGIGGLFGMLALIWTCEGCACYGGGRGCCVLVHAALTSQHTAGSSGIAYASDGESESLSPKHSLGLSSSPWFFLSWLRWKTCATTSCACCWRKTWATRFWRGQRLMSLALHKVQRLNWWRQRKCWHAIISLTDGRRRRWINALPLSEFVKATPERSDFPFPRVKKVCGNATDARFGHADSFGCLLGKNMWTHRMHVLLWLSRCFPHT